MGRFASTLGGCVVMIVLSLGLFLGLGLRCVEAQCPGKERIREAVRPFIRGEMEILAIRPAPVGGLCEVAVKVKGRSRIFYIDSEARHLFMGQILEIGTKRNLTREAAEELARLEPRDMERLEELTAFEEGKAEKVLYFVTDPQCPYCRKAEKVLRQLVQGGEVTVRFLLFPLSFHKGAMEQCVAILCDHKGWQGLESGYRSQNQCEEGKRKLEETYQFLSSKGISGTPSYIFPDGRFRAGVMEERELRARLGLKSKPKMPIKDIEP